VGLQGLSAAWQHTTPGPHGRHPDAYVNHNRREIWGTDAIRAFMAREFAGAHVTMEVSEVIDHHGDIIVRAGQRGTGYSAVPNQVDPGVAAALAAIAEPSGGVPGPAARDVGDQPGEAQLRTSPQRPRRPCAFLQGGCGASARCL
jgi:hypothetical protein